MLRLHTCFCFTCLGRATRCVFSHGSTPVQLMHHSIINALDHAGKHNKINPEQSELDCASNHSKIRPMHSKPAMQAGNVIYSLYIRVYTGAIHFPTKAYWDFTEQDERKYNLCFDKESCCNADSVFTKLLEIHSKFKTWPAPNSGHTLAMTKQILAHPLYTIH